MIKIKTALLSVYDKSGIISLAETLIKNHVEILSSGGTANFLKENGIEVLEVVFVLQMILSLCLYIQRDHVLCKEVCPY